MSKNKTLIIHAGMHKTGSTSIQSWLARTAPSKRIYAFSHHGNRYNMGLPLFTVFASQPEKHYFWRTASRPDRLRVAKIRYEQLLLDHCECNASVHIISSEDLANFSEEEHSRLISFFKPYYAKILVLMFLRDPYSYIDSAFQEKVKTGFCDLDFSKVLPSYKKRLDTLNSCYGFNSTNIIDYNESRSSIQALSVKILDLTGVSLSQSFVDQINVPSDKLLGSAALNTRMNSTAIKVLFGYHLFNKKNFNPYNSSRSSTLIKLLEGAPGKKAEISWEIKAQTIETIMHELNWIRDTYQIDLGKEMEVNSSIYYIDSKNISIVDEDMKRWLNGILSRHSATDPYYTDSNAVNEEEFFAKLAEYLQGRFKRGLTEAVT